MKRLGIAAVAVTLLAVGCSGTEESTGTTTGAAAPDATTPSTEAEIEQPPSTEPPSTEPAAPAIVRPEPTAADEETMSAIVAAIEAAPVGCDPLDTRQCVFPFPSNATTVVDASTQTGLRVAFPADGLPANAAGAHIDPTEWNRNDGFSPNSTLLTHVPGLDHAASNLPTWTDLGASLAPDANVVMVDLADGERVPLWAERDAEATSPDDELLVVQPAIGLREGHTYMVAMRGLVDGAGEPIEASPVFRAYRDALTTGIDTIETRRSEMEAGFAALAESGIDALELQLAWTFTVASTEAITGRMLHIRDRTLAALGGFAPEYTITDVIGGDAVEPEGIARQVVGTYSVVNWLTGDGGPGNRFQYGDDGQPIENGVVQAPFICNIPDTTVAGTEPAHLVQYGHGLLGSEREVNAGNVRAMANEHNAVYCATKWAGMSEDDVANAVASLTDFSNFPTMADRLQQGVLNQIVLGRLMLLDDGLAMHPGFQRADGTPLIDTSELVYDGNSQGGIMGQMLAAVSPDFEQAVLGVTGMNYSLLLPRSVDFDTYAAVMDPNYPNTLDQRLVISVIQMLWDRGEGAGYTRHVVSDPLPGTNAKNVLLHVALGDHQVTELSAYIAARTMGIPIHRPVVGDGRSDEVEPGWGIGSLAAGDTSALVIWDSGAPKIPIEATPPRAGTDPHEDPRADVEVRRQKAAFLWGGEILDVCGGAACTAARRS